MQKASLRAQRITSIEEVETAWKKELDGWTYADQKKDTEKRQEPGQVVVKGTKAKGGER